MTMVMNISLEEAKEMKGR